MVCRSRSPETNLYSQTEYFLCTPEVRLLVDAGKGGVKFDMNLFYLYLCKSVLVYWNFADTFANIVIKDSFCEIKHHKNVSLSLKCFTYLSSFRFEFFYLKKRKIFCCFLIVYNIVFFICHFCIEYWFSLKVRLTTSINVCLSDTCGISKDLLSVGWGYELQEEINIERLYRITVHPENLPATHLSY